MKTQSIATISAILLAAMLFISPAWGESPGVQRVSYETFVDLQIQHNEFKSTLGSPNTPNLRKIAEDARMKADFLRENRDALVTGMRSLDIENKPYKMTLYLNQTFYNAIRDDGTFLIADSAEE